MSYFGYKPTKICNILCNIYKEQQFYPGMIREKKTFRHSINKFLRLFTTHTHTTILIFFPKIISRGCLFHTFIIFNLLLFSRLNHTVTTIPFLFFIFFSLSHYFSCFLKLKKTEWHHWCDWKWGEINSIYNNKAKKKKH